MKIEWDDGEQTWEHGPLVIKMFCIDELYAEFIILEKKTRDWWAAMKEAGKRWESENNLGAFVERLGPLKLKPDSPW